MVTRTLRARCLPATGVVWAGMLGIALTGCHGWVKAKGVVGAGGTAGYSSDPLDGKWMGPDAVFGARAIPHALVIVVHAPSDKAPPVGICSKWAEEIEAGYQAGQSAMYTDPAGRFQVKTLRSLWQGDNTVILCVVHPDYEPFELRGVLDLWPDVWRGHKLVRITLKPRAR